MLEMYTQENQELKRTDEMNGHVWILMPEATQQECELVEERYGIDPADLEAALDLEEGSRVEITDGYVLILIDIPVHDDSFSISYSTLPLGIVLVDDAIITICSRETDILDSLASGLFKDIDLSKPFRFVYQILYQTSQFYQQDLMQIDKKRREIEKNIGKSTKDSDLITLHNLESTLVYFATSLHANEGVLDRLSRYTRLRRYPEDKDLMDDVYVEMKQCIEMTSIYRDVIRRTRDLISNLLDNKLNNVMKYLTSITLVMAIPTIISGFYGMNVDEKWMPLANTPFGFDIICVLTLILCIAILWVLKKKNML